MVSSPRAAEPSLSKCEVRVAAGAVHVAVVGERDGRPVSRKGPCASSTCVVDKKAEVVVLCEGPTGTPREAYDLSKHTPQELIQNLQVNQKTGVLRVESQFRQGPPAAWASVV